MLLTRADLGPSWTNAAQDDLGPIALCSGASLDEGVALEDAAQAAFSSSRGENLVQWVLLMPAADAETVMGRARESLACAEAVMPLDDGTELRWTLSPLDASGIGDEAVAAAFDVRSSNPVYTPQRGGMVVFRVGRVISTLFYVGFHTSPESVLESARVAAERLAAAELAP